MWSSTFELGLNKPCTIIVSKKKSLPKNGNSWIDSVLLGTIIVSKDNRPNIPLIGHLRITFGLLLKASLGAHPFIWKLVFIHMQMKTNFHMKEWAPGLALRKRPKVMRKWSIKYMKLGPERRFFLRILSSTLKIYGPKTRILPKRGEK